MSEVAKIDPQDSAPAQTQEAPFAAQIERICMNPEIPLDRLEKMLDMKERMEDRQREDEVRQAQREFFAALSDAQGAIPVVLKNKANDQTRSRYADLAAIEDQAMPVIREHGFSVSAWSKPGAPDGFQRVAFRVAHRAGHFDQIEDDFALDDKGAQGKVNKTQLHAKGSTVSYARRYLLTGYFNIATSDDDGNTGGGKSSGPITEDQFTALRDLIDQAEVDEGKLLRYFKIDHLGELSASRYGEADAMLRQKIKKKEAQQ